MDNKRPKTIFICDFDDTLFNRSQFKKELKRVFGRVQVGPAVFKQTYRWTKKLDGTYNPQKHLAILAKILPRFDKKKARLALEKFLRQSKKFVFPEASNFLKKASQNSRLILLTFGALAWQKAKVKNSGLAHFFDKTFFTQDSTKQEVLEKILPKLSKERIVFLEDSGPTLSAVKKRWPAVLTVQVVRPGCRGGQNKKNVADLQVRNLTGLFRKLCTNA